MKRILALVIIILLFTSCPEAKESVKKSNMLAEYEVAFEILQESELQNLLKVFPTVQSDFEKKSYEREQSPMQNEESKVAQNLVQGILSPYKNLNQEIPDLETKLKDLGMPWKEFWPAFAKTQIVTLLLFTGSEMGLLDEEGNVWDRRTIEERKEDIEERLNDPKTDFTLKEMLKSEKQLWELIDKVPNANIMLAKKYREQLVPIMQSMF